jgi:hypothetical protein
MVTLRARFDGRVFVPEGPVDLPRGEVLELRVEKVGGEDAGRRAEGFDVVNGLAVFRVPGGAKVVTDEDVRRAEDEW